MFFDFTTSEWVTIVSVIVYIILTSIAASQYHNVLDTIKRQEIRFRLRKISKEQLQQSLNVQQREIKRQKKVSYSALLLFGITHIFGCLVLDYNVLSSIIPFCLFSFVLFGNYWLQGRGVLSAIDDLPGFSDFEL